MKTSITILTLLQAMGLTNKKILYTLREKILGQENMKTSQALYKLNKILMNKDGNFLRFKKLNSINLVKIKI
jgi:hypothetical protein